MNKKDLLFSNILKSDRIHFIGIGGVGMGSLAEIMINLGYNISGSDIIENSMIIRLKNLVSSAISKTNEEILTAKKYNIPVIKRAEMLSRLMKYKYKIIVSGTHGKTTTTAMIYSIFKSAHLHPTYINGGQLIREDTYSYLDNGRYWIAEADESDASFLYFKPTVAIVTSIDEEHLNFYQGKFNNLKLAFIKFLNNVSYDGYVVLCIDDTAIQEILPKINRKVITYGFNKNSDLYITNYFHKRFLFTFEVYIKKIKQYISINLKTPGNFNILNATAAIAVALEEGINHDIILNSILKFPGVYRRFNYKNNYDLKLINKKLGKITLIDDYGHHPTEIQLTIQIIRDLWCNRRLIMVFQPHRYTRMQSLYEDFIKTLSQVDILLILEVYPAGEKSISEINSKKFCKDIKNIKKIRAIFVLNKFILYKELDSLLVDNDILLLQGAGDIELIFKQLMGRMRLN
uniref:UDP-N-acetylmuramate--L-alanine ligase n=1 Tax=Glossina palpalis gambiensis TaxID=67801 RepID=A0A1B0C1S8_9MUSC